MVVKITFAFKVNINETEILFHFMYDHLFISNTYFILKTSYVLLQLLCCNKKGLHKLHHFRVQCNISLYDSLCITFFHDFTERRTLCWKFKLNSWWTHFSAFMHSGSKAQTKRWFLTWLLKACLFLFLFILVGKEFQE